MKPTTQPATDEPRILAIPTAPVNSARRLLESVVAAALSECRDKGLPDCRVTLDVGDGHTIAADSRAVGALLLPLVVAAMERSVGQQSRRPPLRPEVLITTIDIAGALEIEVADWADNGPAVSPPADQDIVRLLDRTEGSLRFEGCPDGGTACTLRFPHSRSRRKVA
jgi:hypothetical protein